MNKNQSISKLWAYGKEILQQNNNDNKMQGKLSTDLYLKLNTQTVSVEINYLLKCPKCLFHIDSDSIAH